MCAVVPWSYHMGHTHEIWYLDNTHSNSCMFLHLSIIGVTTLEGMQDTRKVAIGEGVKERRETIVISS